MFSRMLISRKEVKAEAQEARRKTKFSSTLDKITEDPIGEEQESPREPPSLAIRREARLASKLTGFWRMIYQHHLWKRRAINELMSKNLTDECTSIAQLNLKAIIHANLICRIGIAGVRFEYDDIRLLEKMVG